jgi:hypothetical protein
VTDADQFLCQERDEQFPTKPSTKTVVVMFGHMPQLGKASQSLNHQLNLPTHTMDLRTSAVEPLKQVVNTITYLTNSAVPDLVIICFLLALRCNRR